MIQNYISDLLGVNPDRGIVRFIGIAEEYLATNGMTMQGEIDNLGKESSEESTENKRSNTLRRGRSRKASKPEKLNLQERSRSGTRDNLSSPALRSPPLPAIPREMSPMDKKAEKVQKMGRRRSFLAMFSGNKPKIST